MKWAVQVEQIQSTCMVVDTRSSVFEMSKKREICHRHSRRQTVANRGWSAQRWLHRRGRRQCESFLVRLSRCAGNNPIADCAPCHRCDRETDAKLPSSRRRVTSRAPQVAVQCGLDKVRPGRPAREHRRRGANGCAAAPRCDGV